METAVTALGVRKTFGERLVLGAVDLAVGQGQVVALFGRNGGGKSTLIRIIGSIIKPDSGKVKIGDIDVHADAAKARRLLGLIGHKSCLDPQLTLGENLRIAAGLSAIPAATWRSRADRLLVELQLTEYRHEPVATFSRGTLQRAAIARALLHDPPVLLLDEPFTGLDLRGVEILQQMIRTWREENRAVLLVSHQFRDTAELADDVAVLHDGEIHHPPPERQGDLDHLEARYRALLRG